MAPSNSQQISQHIPGEKSSRPALALLAGWLVPGAGHLVAGKPFRAALLFVSVVSMFAIGLGMQGKIYTPNTGEILDILGFAGDLGLGLIYAAARMFGWGASSVITVTGDYGDEVHCGGGAAQPDRGGRRSLSRERTEGVRMTHFSAGAALRIFHVDRFRHHAARAAEADAAFRRVLLRAFRRHHDRGELVDVGDQALSSRSRWIFKRTLNL